MNLEILDSCWKELKDVMHNGLLDGAFWSRSTGLAISTEGDYRSDFIALFSRVLDEIDKMLESSHFPALNRYIMLNLAEIGIIVIVIKHSNDLFQGMALDPKRINLGLLFSVVVPKAIAKAREAGVQGEEPK